MCSRSTAASLGSGVPLARLVSSAPFKWLLRLAIAAAILAYIFQRVPLAEVMRQLEGVDPLLLAAAFGLACAVRLVGALQFKHLTDVQEMRVSVARILYINAATSFYQLFLPGYISGGAIRWYKLADGASRADRALAAILASRLFDCTVAAALMAILYAADAGAGAAHPVAALLCGSAAAVPVACAAMGLAQRIGSGLEARFSADGGPPQSRLARALHRVLRPLLRFHWLSPRELATSALLLALFHGLAGVSWYFLARAVDIDVSLLAISWIRIAVYLAVLVPISFSGAGVREGILIVLLAPLGVPSSAALALGLLQLGLSLAMGVLGGIVEFVALALPGAAPRAEPPTS